MFHLSWIYIPRSEIASFDDSMFTFRRPVRLFSKVTAPVYIPAAMNEGSSSFYLWQHLLISFFTLATQECVNWCLLVVLVCISLKANDVQHLLICLLAICISSLEKCLFPIIYLL